MLTAGISRFVTLLQTPRDDCLELKNLNEIRLEVKMSQINLFKHFIMFTYSSRNGINFPRTLNKHPESVSVNNSLLKCLKWSTLVSKQLYYVKLEPLVEHFVDQPDIDDRYHKIF